MIVFDTSVLIAHLRGDERATDLLLETPGRERLASVLARIEIEGGMRSAERGAVASLFSVLRLIPVTDPIARRAGELLRTYRRSHTGIDLVDYAVAATAEVNAARLATLNIKHFPMFPGLLHPGSWAPASRELLTGQKSKRPSKCSPTSGRVSWYAAIRWPPGVRNEQTGPWGISNVRSRCQPRPSSSASVVSRLATR